MTNGMPLSAATPRESGSANEFGNVFLQSREGVVDRSVLGTYGFRSPVFTSPEFKRYWSRVRGQFDASFAEALEEANGLR